MNVHVQGNVSLQVSEMNAQKSLGLVVAAGSGGATVSPTRSAGGESVSLLSPGPSDRHAVPSHVLLTCISPWAVMLSSVSRLSCHLHVLSSETSFLAFCPLSTWAIFFVYIPDTSLSSGMRFAPSL